MRLKIQLPDEALLDEEVLSVSAEAADGSFCLLPRHVDFVTALVPGILSFQTAAGEEFVAVDEGVLVKSGPEVLVSARGAVRSTGLPELKQAVRERIRRLDERERLARAALARMEASVVRSFVELHQARP
jgi:F-type H+-transporting ATPase subunit epsilon